MMRWRQIALAACCAVALAGCGDSDVQEVRQWMAGVEKQARVAVPPLSEPKSFIPFAYTAKDAPDPFSPNKLMAELAKAGGTGGAPGPDLARRKELLETFPLDTFKMVGSLQKGGVNYALLQIDRTVYQVKAGQYLGQNFGLITSVGEDVVNLKETVQDAAGVWGERLSRLELQESKESKESGK
jgi:type IV pilus assembly protein PilP